MMLMVSTVNNLRSAREKMLSLFNIFHLSGAILALGLKLRNRFEFSITVSSPGSGTVLTSV